MPDDVSTPLLWADAACPFLANAVVQEVVYRGSAAVVCRVDDQLLPITHPRRGLIPGGVCFGDGDAFARWAATSNRLIGRPLSDSLVVTTTTDLTVIPQPFDPRAVRLLHQKLSGVERVDPLTVDDLPQAALQIVAACGASAEDGTVWQQVESIIGRGPGMTPSGDDILVGIVAGLRGSGRLTAATRLAHVALAQSAATTETSRYFFRHAASGRFAQVVHEALAAVAPDPSPASDRVDELVRRAADWGAHSGIDLLTGLAAAYGYRTTGTQTREEAA